MFDPCMVQLVEPSIASREFVFVGVRISRSRSTDPITVYARLASKVFLSSLKITVFRQPAKPHHPWAHTKMQMSRSPCRRSVPAGNSETYGDIKWDCVSSWTKV
jgi:hypothetical protein